MDNIPSISFRDGYPVVVEDDRYEVLRSEGEIVAFEELMSLLADYERLYFVDINGIERDHPQMDLIARLSTRRELWVDCGVRDMNTLLDLYVSGADRVVVSTKSMIDLAFIGEAVEISDRMVFCMDFFAGNMISSMEDTDMIELLEKAVELGYDTVVINNLDEVPLDLSELRNAPRGDHHIYVGGRVKNGDDEQIKGRILDLKEI